MNEYLKQAQDFLRTCDATMTIKYLGKNVNALWDDGEIRNTYEVNIITPRSSMQVTFWDSVYSTEKDIKADEYDILACLQKYKVGTFEDFVYEFGYEITSNEEYCRIQKTYNLCKKEYKDICRCFTPAQIKLLREIV